MSVGNTGITMPKPIVSINTAASTIGTARFWKRMKTFPPA